MTAAQTTGRTAADYGVDAIVTELPDFLPVVDVDPAAADLARARARSVELWTSVELDHITDPTAAEIAAVARYAAACALMEHPGPGRHWTDREADVQESIAAERAVQRAKRAAGRRIVAAVTKSRRATRYYR